MERSHSFSSSFTERATPPRIATVRPVSKSFSEDDLMKASENHISSLYSPTRVISHFKVQDLSLLKKDNIISELEKCLGELESEHGYAQRLGDVYEKVESERNQLLDELDLAFQDLQQYMQKQKVIEDEKLNIENSREELLKENEELQRENDCLKAVLSNRNEIFNNKLQEENRQYLERIKELEIKNTQHLDEINELYEERTTLIHSLLNLRSDEVEDVIRKTSRSNSLCSQKSIDEFDVPGNLQLDVLVEQANDGNFDIEAHIKTLKDVQSENEELKDAFKRIRKERDTAEQELDRAREEKEHLDQMYALKIRDYGILQEKRNEKNLSLSKIKNEQRTLQRQYDHMRENNRSLNGNVSSLTQEVETLREKKRQLSITKSNGIEERKDEVDGTANIKRNIELNDTIKDLELKNNELSTSKSNLEDKLKVNGNMYNSLNEKFDREFNENSALRDIAELLKKEIGELKATSNEKYSDLVVEYDNIRNQNQHLQNKVDKLNSEKENIRLELSNYKSEVIEKIKQNLEELEQERINLLSQNESLEKTVKVKQESEQELKETCSKLLKQVDETKEKKNGGSDSEEQTIIQRKYDVLQKDYDRMLQKCRQLEKSVTDSAGLHDEVKRLKDANEMLLQRYRSLESDCDQKSKTCEEELQNYSALLLKYENIREEYDIVCQQYETLENENKEACDNYDQVINENKLLCKQYDELYHEHKQTRNKYDGLVKENKNLVEKVNKYNNERVDSANTNKILSKNNDQLTVNGTILESVTIDVNQEINNQTIIKNLQNEKTNLLNRKNDLQNEKGDLEIHLLSLSGEIKQLKDFNKNAENTRISLEDKLQQIEQEKNTVKTKYELLCVDVEKITTENTHFSLTVETLRAENKRLNEALRKQRLVSSSSQDLIIQRLQDESENFQQQVDILQTNLSNSISENKNLLERINRSDESTATTLRSLKARKNELQLQVETLKHENDFLKKMPKSKEKRYKFGKSSGEKNTEIHLNESLRNAHAKMAELQLENDELKHKLQEYESLLNGQHQALAHANDLAMQKNLEASKMKRSLEKKMDKLTQENNELRRIIFLLDDPSVNNLSPKNSLSDDPRERKNSEHSVVNITFSTDDVDKNKSVSDKPQLISVATVSKPYSERLSSISSVPESPRLLSSRQVENDLSQQLRELLDLSNNLLPPDDDQRSHVSDESVAPPVPPPPTSYGSSSRGEYNSDKQQHEEVSTPDTTTTTTATTTTPTTTIEKIVNEKLEHWV